MKSRAILASMTLLLLGSLSALTATAQSQDDSTAKQDFKDAGHAPKKPPRKPAAPQRRP
jgi:hypothetical protein